MRRKYRIKKQVKNFLIFYAFICILFMASYTLSRYVGLTVGTSDIDIAKFNVSVNGIDVKDDTPIKFDISDSTTFTSEKIAPHGTGYFEFIIDPNGTEVSLEYEIEFMLDELDEDFKLTYYTINDSENHYDITDENIVKNDLTFSSTKIKTGFTEDDTLNIKVYWIWDEQEEILNPDMDIYDNKNISILAIVRQKIN